MSWRDLEGINSPLDPPFYDFDDEYVALVEHLAELEEEELEETFGGPDYRLLDGIPLEDLPF